MSGLTCSRCGHRWDSVNDAAEQGQCPQCGSALVAPASSEPDTALSIHKPAEAISPLFGDRRLAELNPKITTNFGANLLPDDGKLDFEFLSPPQQPGELGRLGAYRVHKVLGTGGMGIVFQAEDGHLQRLVALKVLKPALAANASFRQRFLREARAIAAVKNDHIVSIHQVGIGGGVPFLAMEFLEGETLDSRLEREKRLPLGEVLRIGREAAEGLAAAHDRGMVHRDIKPANIWLESHVAQAGTRKGGRVKILDFGLARGAGADPNLTETGLILGTPYYMAPEQARAEPVDGRCDLFSLGCVLYKAATGVVPFAGSDTMSVLSALATHTPAPLIALNPEVPPPLSDLVQHMLAKDPSARPASANVVVELIEAIEHEYPQAGKPFDSGERRPLSTGEIKGPSSITTAVTRRKPRQLLFYLLAIAFVAASLLLVIAIGSNQFAREAGNPAPHDAGQAAFDVLQARADDPHADREQLRQDLLAFVLNNPATAQAVKAAELLKQLPSPLDELDPDRIPVEDRPARLPGLVGVLKGHVGPVWTVAFAPDGKKLASGGGGGTDHTVRLWDLTGPEAKPGPIFRGHEGTVTGISFALDGKRLASSSIDGSVRIWGLGADEAKRHTLRGDGPPIMCVTLAPDGKTLACGEGQDIRIWDLSNEKAPQRRAILKGHTNQVNSVAFARDGRTLASASADQTVILWDFSVPQPRKKSVIKGQTSGVTSVAFARDAKTLATASDDRTVWLWQLGGKEPREQSMLDGHTNKVNSVTFAPDDKALLSAGNDGRVVLWNMPAGNRLREWQFPDIVHRAAFAPGGRHVAVAHDNGLIYVLRISPATTK